LAPAACALSLTSVPHHPTTSSGLPEILLDYQCPGSISGYGLRSAPYHRPHPSLSPPATQGGRASFTCPRRPLDPSPGQAGRWPACFATAGVARMIPGWYLPSTPRVYSLAHRPASCCTGAPHSHHAPATAGTGAHTLRSDHRIHSNSTRAGRSRGAHPDATAQHRSERASSIQKMMDHQVAQKFKTRISMLCLTAALLQGSCGVRRPHPNSDPPPASRRAASARPVRDQRQGRDASSGRASRAGSARDRVM